MWTRSSSTLLCRCLPLEHLGQSSLAKGMAERAYLEILSRLAAWCGLIVVMKSCNVIPQSGLVRERYHLRVGTGHQDLSSAETECLEMSGTKMSEG